MNVGKICQHQVVTVRPLDGVTAAAELMREKHVGFLVVVEPAPSGGAVTPIGVLTDRDIVVSIVAKGVDPRAFTVGDLMSSKPVVVNESDALEEALRSMHRTGVRRLPVVGRSGELKGVVSIDDVLKCLASGIQSVAGAIRNERQIEGIMRS